MIRFIYINKLLKNPNFKAAPQSKVPHFLENILVAYTPKNIKMKACSLKIFQQRNDISAAIVCRKISSLPAKFRKFIILPQNFKNPHLLKTPFVSIEKSAISKFFTCLRGNHLWFFFSSHSPQKGCWGHTISNGIFCGDDKNSTSGNRGHISRVYSAEFSEGFDLLPLNSFPQSGAQFNFKSNNGDIFRQMLHKLQQYFFFYPENEWKFNISAELPGWCSKIKGGVSFHLLCDLCFFAKRKRVRLGVWGAKRTKNPPKKNYLFLLSPPKILHAIPMCE